MKKLKHIFFRIFGNKKARLFCYALAIFLAYLYSNNNNEKPNLAYKNVTNLSEAENSYYEQIFDYVMASVRDGDVYKWQTYSSSGEITPQNEYISKSGVKCRAFNEKYRIGVKSGEAKGIGCKRAGAEGWCKLKPDAMQSCALEQPKTDAGRVIRDARDVANQTQQWIKGTIDFW